MNALRRAAAAATARRRRPGSDQRGYTLIEVLLVVTISAVILVPLMAWSVLVVTRQDDIDSDLGRANSTGFLNSYLSRDVASSRYVKEGGGACAGAAVGSQPQLQLVPAGVDRRIVYVEAPATDPGGPVTTSLWRTECDATGALVDQIEVVRGIRSGSAEVGCYGSTGQGACAQDENRQVGMSVLPLRADGTNGPRIDLRVLRRTSSASIGSPSTANRHPVAQLTITPPRGYGSTSFDVSAADSFDVDGTIASYEWSFPPGAVCSPSGDGSHQSCSFPVVGDHLVQVTVTDDKGAVNSSTGTVTVFNQFPVASGSVSPTVGTVGATSFAFDGSGSVDPDGGPLTYQWDLGEDIGAARYLSGPNPTFTFPEGTPTGLRQVGLVVTDGNGDNDAFLLVVELTGAEAPPSDGTRIGDVTISPALISNGSGVPRLAESVGPDLPARTVSFSSSTPPPDGSTTTWELRRRGTATVVASGSGTTFSHSFGAGDGGEYDIVMTVTPFGGQPVASAPGSFRVNTAPVAAFTSSGGGAAPQSISFDSSGSSDSDGSIASYRWSFGFFDQWVSSNPSPVWSYTDPGTYLVTLEVTDSDGATARYVRTITISGTPNRPAGLAWNGSTLGWSAVPGAGSYRVSLVYPCGTFQYPVAAGPTPSLPAAMATEVCGAPGVVQAYVETEVNRVYSSMSGPVGASG